MSILTPKDYEKLYNTIKSQSNVLLAETGVPKHKIKSEMTDKEYAQYLFEWLRFDSSEDICSKCVNCPKDNFCLNADPNSVDFDYNTCFYGIKKYAEGHRTNKK